MGFNISAAGAFASGVGRGLDSFQQGKERQQRMSLADADQRWQEQQRGRQQQQWQREDEMRALEQESMASGMKAIEEDRAAYDQAPAPLGLDGKPGAKAPYAPSKKAILRAAQAQQDFYFHKGRADLGIAMDAKLEPMRTSMKGEAAKGLLDAMQTGKDITPAMREYDALNNDGFEIDGKVQSITQPDGTTAYRVKRKNRFTGEAEPERTLSQQQLVQAMATNIGKPEDAAKFNQSMLLESFKHGNTLKEIDRRTEGAVEVAKTRGDTAETVAKIRVSGTITAAQIRKAAGGGGSGGDNKVQSTKTLADGRIVAIMKDGSAKVMTHDDGKPMAAIDYEKLVGTTAGQVGKTIEGSLASPEANRGRARSMLPQPPAGSPAGLPPGSKQIGTSGGKPVYQTPDGKRFIQE